MLHKINVKVTNNRLQIVAILSIFPVLGFLFVLFKEAVNHQSDIRPQIKMDSQPGDCRWPF